jgi:hypothetical protein
MEIIKLISQCRTAWQISLHILTFVKNYAFCTPMATSPEASGDDGTQGFTLYA